MRVMAGGGGGGRPIFKDLLPCPTTVGSNIKKEGYVTGTTKSGD